MLFEPPDIFVQLITFKTPSPILFLVKKIKCDETKIKEKLIGI